MLNIISEGGNTQAFHCMITILGTKNRATLFENESKRKRVFAHESHQKAVMAKDSS